MIIIDNLVHSFAFQL